MFLSAHAMFWAGEARGRFARRAGEYPGAVCAKGKKSPGQGAVYFYRDHDDGDGVDFAIEENGRAIAILADRTYTIYFAKPGRHFFSAVTEGSDNPKRKDGQFIQVMEGENSYLQVLAEATTFSAKPRVFVAFEQQARPVIETLTYIAPKE